MAIAGEVIIQQAAATALHQHLGFGFDFGPLWRADFAMFHGHAPAIDASAQNWWPLPLEVFFLPLGGLSSAIVQGITVVGTAGLLILAVCLWCRRWEQLPSQPALLFSLPVLSTIGIDQFQAALGLAGLSLALWADQRARSSLVGVGIAVSLIRPANALPILAMLIVSLWRRPREAVVVGLSALAIFAPLTAIAMFFQPAWAHAYLLTLQAYSISGFLGVIHDRIGQIGLIGLALVNVLFAIWLALQRRDGPLDLDQCAAVMAMTVLITPLPGLYCLIYVIPAAIRVGQRPGLGFAPWLLLIAPWIVVFALSPVLLGPAPQTLLNMLPTLNLWLIAAAFPLLRKPEHPSCTHAMSSLAA